MNGHGELAVIHAHELFLIGAPAKGANGVHYVGFGNRPSDPQWSHDGRWLSVVVTPPPYQHRPYVERPSFVAIVGPRGEVVHEVPRGIDAYDVTTAWSPTADKLAVSYSLHHKNGDVSRMVLSFIDPTTGVSDGLVAAPELSGFAWSPDGTQLAFVSNRFYGTPQQWHSRLVTVDAGTDARHLVTTATGNVLEVAGWWPDGSGILTRLDYGGSASLAADGLPLFDVSLANGHRRRLPGLALAYPQWLATSKLSNQIAYVAGGDREVTLGDKHIEVCGAASCRSVSQGAHQVSFDPAWDSSGFLLFVRDRAVDPAHGYGASYVDQIQASGRVDIGSPSTPAKPLAGTGGASAPTPGKGAVLFVRRGGLWLLTAGQRRAVEVVSGLQVPSNYYGFVPWHDSFAWTDAVTS
jgi:hypothetical protein